MKTDKNSSPRNLLRGLIEWQKHLLENKVFHNMPKEKSHVLLQAHQNHHLQSHLASRQILRMKIDQQSQLEKSIEKRQVRFYRIDF